MLALPTADDQQPQPTTNDQRPTTNDRQPAKGEPAGGRESIYRAPELVAPRCHVRVRAREAHPEPRSAHTGGWTPSVQRTWLNQAVSTRRPAATASTTPFGHLHRPPTRPPVSNRQESHVGWSDPERKSQIEVCSHNQRPGVIPCVQSVSRTRATTRRFRTPGMVFYSGVWRNPERLNAEKRRRALTKRSGAHRKRLGGVCERCGFVPVVPAQLDVHHRDGDHANNDPANLETVCANCHRLEHATTQRAATAA